MVIIFWEYLIPSVDWSREWRLLRYFAYYKREMYMRYLHRQRYGQF